MMRLRCLVVGLTVLGLAPMQAAAECSCLCVDGAFTTVCTDPGQVGVNVALCQAVQARQSCPDNPPAGESAAYAAPMEGVQNCRDAQVYDASSDDYVVARICDVAAGELNGL